MMMKKQASCFLSFSMEAYYDVAHVHDDDDYDDADEC